MTGLFLNMRKMVLIMTEFDSFFNHMGPAQQGLLVQFCSAQLKTYSGIHGLVQRNYCSGERFPKCQRKIFPPKITNKAWLYLFSTSFVIFFVQLLTFYRIIPKRLLNALCRKGKENLSSHFSVKRNLSSIFFYSNRLECYLGVKVSSMLLVPANRNRNRNRNSL